MLGGQCGEKQRRHSAARYRGRGLSTRPVNTISGWSWRTTYRWVKLNVCFLPTQDALLRSQTDPTLALVCPPSRRDFAEYGSVSTFVLLWLLAD